MDAPPEKEIGVNDPNLIEEIGQAFAPTALNRAIDIAYPGRWFDEGGVLHTYDDPESTEAARFLSGKTWRDLVGPPLLKWGPAASSLLHLTPTGLATYAPAYLCSFLGWQNDGIAWAILDSMVSRLTIPDQTADSEALRRRYGGRSDLQREAMWRCEVEHFRAFVKCLSVSQTKTIARFLQAVIPFFEGDYTDNLARLAFEKFWERRLA